MNELIKDSQPIQNKIEINADEVIKHIEYIRWLNSQKLEDILWVNNKNEPIEISQEKYEYWDYIGMNNSSFVEFMIFDNL